MSGPDFTELATGQPTTGCFADGAYEVGKLCDHDFICTMTVLPTNGATRKSYSSKGHHEKKEVYGTVVYVMSLLYHQGLYSTLSVVQPIVPRRDFLLPLLVLLFV